MSWRDGETLQLLGNTISLQVIKDAKTNKHNLITRVWLSPHPKLMMKSLSKKVIQWYKKQAELDFGRRLAILAAKLNVSTPPLKLSSAQSRWGSCSSRGDIRLNWRLLQAPPSIINYVVCHELAHLKEMNHSAKFWAVVASIYPDYKLAEKELKQLSSQLHRI